MAGLTATPVGILSFSSRPTRCRKWDAIRSPARGIVFPGGLRYTRIPSDFLRNDQSPHQACSRSSATTTNEAFPKASFTACGCRKNCWPEEARRSGTDSSSLYRWRADHRPTFPPPRKAATFCSVAHPLKAACPAALPEAVDEFVRSPFREEAAARLPGFVQNCCPTPIKQLVANSSDFSPRSLQCAPANDHGVDARQFQIDRFPAASAAASFNGGTTPGVSRGSTLLGSAAAVHQSGARCGRSIARSPPAANFLDCGQRLLGERFGRAGMRRMPFRDDRIPAAMAPRPKSPPDALAEAKMESYWARRHKSGPRGP